MSILDKTNEYQTKLLEELGLASLPDQQKTDAVQMVTDRFHSVIINTMIRSLSPEQAKEMTDKIKNGDDIEETVAEITSRSPDLTILIEQALIREYESLKSLMK